ncbi:MAG: hypothetical protein OEY23_03290 [Acidimicrobiia bacterium]|nr:hypothetical protein [Acidimicrobiia bacterium]
MPRRSDPDDLGLPDAPPVESGPRPAVRRAIFFALVAVLAVGGLAAVIWARRGPSTATETQVAEQMRIVLDQAQQRAEATSSRRFEVPALARSLETAADDYRIDVAASDDRTMIGVAATRPGATTCVLMWTTVAGPRSATVSDPELPCRGEVALAAAK